MKNKILNRMFCILVFITLAIMFILWIIPDTHEEKCKVVDCYNNVITVKDSMDNLYECYGNTKDNEVIAVFSDSKLIDIKAVEK